MSFLNPANPFARLCRVPNPIFAFFRVRQGGMAPG